MPSVKRNLPSGRGGEAFDLETIGREDLLGAGGGEFEEVGSGFRAWRCRWCRLEWRNVPHQLPPISCLADGGDFGRLAGPEVAAIDLAVGERRAVLRRGHDAEVDGVLFVAGVDVADLAGEFEREDFVHAVEQVEDVAIEPAGEVDLAIGADGDLAELRGGVGIRAIGRGLAAVDPRSAAAPSRLCHS